MDDTKTYSIKEIRKALDYMEKNVHAIDITVEFDDRNRLLIKGHDKDANHIQVTVYNAVSRKMSEVTQTTRLPG